eukprot:TRINITY_DN13702_c0_g1_i1.p1 TRINITY_DN13702_c0_g1~~TRINITY_DN13702_c0_g1_i1.p1  ORF type:complete len:314 (-),score=156.13 TRINITY_DN13702_c0_g1_i1:3-815(-)
MVEMLLTAKHDLGQTPEQHEHQEVEFLLENYHREAADLLAQTTIMRRTISSSVDVANITLSNSRNRLLRLNVVMTMGTLGFAAGSMVAGIFGMNLTHGFEDHPTFFYMTTGVIFIMSSAIMATLYKSARGTAVVHRRNVDSAKAVRRLFRNMDRVAHVLVNHMGGKVNNVNKDGFAQLYHDVCKTPLSASEVDIIFDVFDENNDGYLELQEILNARQRRIADDDFELSVVEESTRRAQAAYARASSSSSSQEDTLESIMDEPRGRSRRSK